MDNGKILPVDGFKTGWDIQKLNLSAAHPSKQKVYVNLRIGMRNGNPCFVLCTNDPDAKKDRSRNYGKIFAAFDLTTMISIGNKLNDLLDEYRENRQAGPASVSVVARGREGNDREAAIVDTARITVARGDNGVFGIVFQDLRNISDRFPETKFRFGVSDNRWTRWESEGQPMDGAVLSSIYARTWANILVNSTMTNALINHVPFDPNAQNNRRGGNGGGGGGNGNYRRDYNGGGNGGGGGNRAPSSKQDDFDDIAF